MRFLSHFSLSAQPVSKITYVIRVTFVRSDTVRKNESAINKYYWNFDYENYLILLSEG